MGYFGAFDTMNMVDFLTHTASTYTIFTFCKKKWSKTTNPALSSGLKTTLPHIWGHHHQQDDEHRDPIVDRKNI